MWLLDCSVVGWYRTQKDAYKYSARARSWHVLARAGPRRSGSRRRRSRKLSWEACVKHVVARAPRRRALVLVGAEVRDALGPARLGALRDAARLSRPRGCVRAQRVGARRLRSPLRGLARALGGVLVGDPPGPRPRAAGGEQAML